MLDSLKKVGREIGRELNRTWENLSDGWRELLSRSGNALTHFSKDKVGESSEGSHSLAGFPNWSLLAGEVFETDTEIVVRLEVPGMEKENCNVTIDGNTLHVIGEKRIEREVDDGRYHLMERAYGSFERIVPLPRNVESENAKAEYTNGVLTVRMPKKGNGGAHSVAVH